MKFYSKRQVEVATFLGSPLAGGILMAHNATIIGQKNAALLYFWATFAITAFLITIGFFLPIPKSGNEFLPLMGILAMGSWYQNAQGDLLTNGKFPDTERASWRATVGISLSILAIIFLLIFGLILLTSPNK